MTGHPALADAAPVPAWLDSPLRPVARPALSADTAADLVVVGGGYSGLWTAVLAKERNPAREVILLEGQRIGWAASGRNGGFCSASLTHGKDNGAQRFPAEIDTLERLGRQNLTELESAIGRYGIACDFELTGGLSVATEPHQVDWLREAADEGDGEFLDQDAIRAQVASPTYLAGLWERDNNALLDPAKLAWGLAETAERLGVRVHESTRVTDLAGDAEGMAVRTASGHTVRASRVALGTNAFPSLVRRVRWHTVPVYDYALMTEPLSAEQLASVGWRHRQGIDDSGNQFHYYRLTADNRILWGGYDAIYHFGRKIDDRLDQRPATFDLLARQFFETFPQLEGLRFTHQWGGAIDTCTRFFAFFGTAYAGRAAYALGYTGLGVGATRFGANVMLDLLDGLDTERTRLQMVRSKPLPFPPEPLAFAGVQLTRWSLAAADRKGGRRNVWLRSLDRMGLGFDS
ncbi:FAD-dependent oxidoreductase [Nocardioides agariphilus]|jgi:glycine/D-amino acid oxidase-like deaminating enzyme|uniref:FAD-dependent oxidoreductase n=1 Tax=Nocardioides agariphilus TaxID=433664 RepID=A0A930VMG4_9ACTN|nr:FAD-dependent oxidoreductase [Nocardioides agariphilus]MBF4767543.1 FAD-dependent oxidoreductase [Nocardioides agariphilus]